jgi:uncharacterized protein YjbI with pentapeptide repeats
LDANLQGANLFNANLERANLWKANLEGAILWRANLEGANLIATRFDEEKILPDRSKWTPDTDMRRFIDPEHDDFWRSNRRSSPAYRPPQSDD